MLKRFLFVISVVIFISALVFLTVEGIRSLSPKPVETLEQTPLPPVMVEEPENRVLNAFCGYGNIVIAEMLDGTKYGFVPEQASYLEFDTMINDGNIENYEIIWAGPKYAIRLDDDNESEIENRSGILYLDNVSCIVETP